MLARVATFAIDGLDPRPVWVEVDVRAGLPAFTIVGLARHGRARGARARPRGDPQLRLRVPAAPHHRQPRARAPAQGRARASTWRSPSALLAASGQMPADALERWAVFGELSLGGELRPCRGALAVAEGARRAGSRGLIVPRERARRGGARRRARGRRRREPARASRRCSTAARCRRAAARPRAAPRAAGRDGARPRRRARPRAAAPGAGDRRGRRPQPAAGRPARARGKTMLARRLPSLLPPLTRDEALEVTRIHSVAGPARRRRPRARAARSARRTTRSRPSGLVGGGAVPTPGRGEPRPPRRAVPRRAVRVRAPGARGAAPAARGRPASRSSAASARCCFPTRFMLVAATNPCPCGFAGSDALPLQRAPTSPATAAGSAGRCSTASTCSSTSQRPTAARARGAPARRRRRRSRERVLGRARAPAARGSPARGAAATPSSTPRLLRAHVRAATPRRAAARAAPTTAAALSARGHDRVLRVARTIADLDGRDAVELDHVLQALALRLRDADDGGGGMSARRDATAACARCLRRSWLIARLSAHIERRRGAARRRCRRLLALADEELLAALGGGGATRSTPSTSASTPARARAALRGRAARRRLPPRRRAIPRGCATCRTRPPCCTSRGDLARLVALRRGADRGRDRRRAPRRPPYGCELARGARARARGRRRDGRQRHGARRSTPPRTPARSTPAAATVAVLAGGADAPTRASKRRLYRADRRASGCVVSELPPGFAAVPLVLPGAQPHHRGARGS